MCAVINDAKVSKIPLQEEPRPGQCGSAGGHVPPGRPSHWLSFLTGSPSALLETWCHFIFLFPAPERKRAQTKVLNPAESSRQMQSPSPAPPDMNTLTFTLLPSPPPPSHLPVFLFFVFLVYCVASRQSLHVSP